VEKTRKTRPVAAAGNTARPPARRRALSAKETAGLRELVSSGNALESKLVGFVIEGAREHWQAAAWLLERGFPERWARVSQREKATGEAPVETDPFAEVDELAEQRRRRA
jgi:hypothetical protein